MSTPPVLGVGIPVYNGARWIGDALDSILGQSFGDFEIVLSNNASTDDTESIVLRYAALDPRIRYVRQDENLGPYRNHDEVFRLSRGRYFKWASCSDICLDGFFERCIAVLDARPEVVVAYPKTRLLIDENGKCWDYEDWLDLDDARAYIRFERYLTRVYLNNPFYGVIRRSALQGTAMNRPLHGSDLNLLSELTLRGRCVELPERMLLRRFTPETTGIWMTREAARELDKAYHIDKSDAARARLHLARLSIPLRAPIGFSDRLRVCLWLLRQLASRRRTAVRLLISRLARVVRRVT